MFYFKISCFAYSRDYIKTHGYIKLKSPDIGVCRFYSMPDFLHSNGVFRLHDSCITAGFNFYYYKRKWKEKAIKLKKRYLPT